MATAERRRIDTLQPIDRAYGLLYSADVPRAFITISRFGEAYFLMTPPHAKDRSLLDYQRYLRERDESGEYRIGLGKRHLLDCDQQQFRSEFLRGILNKTGTTKLWTAGPGGVEDGYMGRRVVTGRVASRRDGREFDVLSKWQVVLKSPVYKDGPGINYHAMSCGCQDYNWGVAKDALVVCVHIAAVVKRAWDEQADPSIPDASRRIRFMETNGPLYLPFSISPMKAMDISFRRYVLNEDMKEIDKKELDVPDNYDPLFLRAIESGRLVYEAIVQKLAEAPYKKEIKERMNVLNNFKSVYLDYQLSQKKSGFVRAGSHALEFKGTPFETVCETYERGNEVIRPVLRADMPPVLVYRVLGDGHRVFYTPDTSHPFSRLFDATEDVDDRTRRTGTKQVIIPGPMMPQGFDATYIHPIFRQDYIKLICDNYRGDAGLLRRQLGLSLI